jgi:hypothetical protein
MAVTTGIFKTRAKEKHDNKYDYSKSIYYKFHEKLIIICTEHGEFLQAPSKHLAGQGCPHCAKIHSNDHLKYKWPESDVNFIIENYQKLGMTICAESLNTYSSNVYKKAKQLGLTKKFKPRTYHNNISKVTWNSLILGAERRKLIVEIIEDDVWNRYLEQNKKCALSGIEIFLHKSSKKITASVDRINSNKGYTKDNIQIVHKDVNRAKSNLSDEEFFTLCKNVYINLSKN